MTRAKRWSLTVGQYGYQVTVVQRGRSPALSLRWWDPVRKQHHWECLGHSDRAAAEATARGKAGALLAGARAQQGERLTIGALFTRWREAEGRHAPAVQRTENERRLAIWTAFLGATRDVATVDHELLRRFVRARQTGTLVVPARRLARAPSLRTIGADLEFLRRVGNWAKGVRTPEGTPLLAANPVYGFPIPVTASPRRPVASLERAVKVLAKATQADPQRLFGDFLELLAGHGWRVTAICALWASDVDLRPTGVWRYGRIRKRGAVDKEDVEMWVPLTRSTQAACRRLLRRRRVMGDVPLFPAPRARGAPQSWSRWHARQLLERAEQLAGLERLEGGDFHPYRRAWATARKHLPLIDVAAAGGWKSPATLLRCYIQPDDATLYQVVTAPAKVAKKRRSAT